MLHQKLLAKVCIGFLGSCILTFLIILDQALPMPLSSYVGPDRRAKHSLMLLML